MASTSATAANSSLRTSLVRACFPGTGGGHSQLGFVAVPFTGECTSGSSHAGGHFMVMYVCTVFETSCQVGIRQSGKERGRGVWSGEKKPSQRSAAFWIKRT